ncbi:ankyrin repeat-containing domain protein [Stachybotrys elegans]|uniref:Ankyrin repeat-containing domain protein n=1 Tax=Stachybotrys elegans TaxID=80388 RepID=A0A8K0SGQ8_9HYPO|nr:ankyrin repeat-containing domain protein [Stachybotrys elegans]
MIYWKTTGIRTAGRFTDLMVASHFGHNAVVKQLLENGAELEAKDEDGRTPLVEAIEGQHVATVQRLLETGAKVDYHFEVRIDRRYTPLSRAAEKGDEKIVELLLKHNAQPDLKDKSGLTPLARAKMEGNVAVANRLEKERTVTSRLEKVLY